MAIHPATLETHGDKLDLSPTQQQLKDDGFPWGFFDPKKPCKSPSSWWSAGNRILGCVEKSSQQGCHYVTFESFTWQFLRWIVPFRSDAENVILFKRDLQIWGWKVFAALNHLQVPIKGGMTLGFLLKVGWLNDHPHIPGRNDRPWCHTIFCWQTCCRWIIWKMTSRRGRFGLLEVDFRPLIDEHV